MKILFVSDYYPPFIKGGAEVSTSLLVDWLSKKHQVNVVCRQLAKKSWNYNGVDIYPIMNYSDIGGGDFKSAITYAFGIFLSPAISSLKLLWLIFRLKPDIVQVVPSSYKFIPIILSVRLFARVPVVVDCRDYSLICPTHLSADIKNFDDTKNTKHGYRCVKAGLTVGSKVLNLFAAPFALYESLVFNFYKRSLMFTVNHGKRLKLVAISEYVRQQLVSNGYKSDTVSVIRNIAPVITQVHAGDIIKSETPFFIFAGRIDKDKGVWDILDAAKILKTRGCHFSIRIAGDGDDTEELKSFLKENDFPQIKFLGKIRPDEVITQYAQSLAILAPSRWPEPSGRFVIEAATVGKPLIATRSGGIPEGVEDGVTGFLVNISDPEQLANAMEQFVLHPEKADEMRPAILAKRSLYDPEQIGQVRTKLYEVLFGIA